MTNGNVKMRTNLVGACDSNPDCLQFIDTNHSPRDLMYSALAYFFSGVTLTLIMILTLVMTLILNLQN